MVKLEFHKAWNIKIYWYCVQKIKQKNIELPIEVDLCFIEDNLEVVNVFVIGKTYYANLLQQFIHGNC